MQHKSGAVIDSDGVTSGKEETVGLDEMYQRLEPVMNFGRG